MRYEFSFPFRGSSHLASVLFSFDEEPYFLSTTLLDEDLMSEFGQSVSIKTDGDHVLHNPSEPVAVIQLKDAVFAYLKDTPAFKQLNEKYSPRKKYRRNKYVKQLKEGL